MKNLEMGKTLPTTGLFKSKEFIKVIERTVANRTIAGANADVSGRICAIYF